MMRQILPTAVCLAVLSALCSRLPAQTAPPSRAPDTGAPTAAAPGTSPSDLPPASLAAQIADLVNDPAVARYHWGVMVTTLDGTPIYSLNEAQLFQPASNAKLYTTSAAMALLGPQATFVTRIFAKGGLSGGGRLQGDVVLVGGGDADISGRPMPYVSPGARPKEDVASTPADPLQHLAEMADQVAATGLKQVTGDVVGDDTMFPWEPYAADWSIDDAVWGYGAPVSALTINDNQLKLTVTPAVTVGRPATVEIRPTIPYYTLDASKLTTGAAKSGNHVQMERPLGSKVLRIYGTLAVDAEPDVEEVAIQDPAEYAAIALKGMLEARGVVVQGVARAEHRPLTQARGFLEQSQQPIRFLERFASQARESAASCGPCDGLPTSAPDLMALHRSSPLREDVKVTNKVSQNLHAELLLHKLGLAIGDDGSEHGTDDASGAQGARVVREFLMDAGIDKDDFVFFDGSGLSNHDLVTPRATAKLLQFASTQPWFADWKASLPVGGEDGSLEGRFAKPPLKDHVFAKTGTLGEARALSGYLDCASGRTVIFSIMVDNHLPGTPADRDTMDKIVAAIQAAE
jgi:D-alanyl-D-alanine carboxypeptidase/D-alanyl-D-alanine-endopeptidase (penicillin-binding protein 4)